MTYFITFILRDSFIMYLFFGSAANWIVCSRRCLFDCNSLTFLTTYVRKAYLRNVLIRFTFIYKPNLRTSEDDYGFYYLEIHYQNMRNWHLLLLGNRFGGQHFFSLIYLATNYDSFALSGSNMECLEYTH